MLIYPAIDLFGGQAVRLYQGDYSRMTVYSAHPEELAAKFEAAGAGCLHMVDLEGARTGETPNLETIRRIRKSTGLFTELGGGIRSMDTVERYLSLGIDRVILGTAAVTNPDFARDAARHFGERIAVGVDLRNGKAAIHGWTEKSDMDGCDLLSRMAELGIGTAIVTDISRDGAMQGANTALYAELQRKTNMRIIASGGVSDIEDVKALRALDLYGAIIGKAYYSGAIDLAEAVRCAG